MSLEYHIWLEAKKEDVVSLVKNHMSHVKMIEEPEYDEVHFMDTPITVMVTGKRSGKGSKILNEICGFDVACNVWCEIFEEDPDYAKKFIKLVDKILLGIKGNIVVASNGDTLILKRIANKITIGKQFFERGMPFDLLSSPWSVVETENAPLGME